MTYNRYAIYWLPEPHSELAGFARGWFGADPDTALPSGTRELYGLDEDLAERATASPRRYGCHATMKAPFRLRERLSEAELAAALAQFCARRRVKQGRLRLRRLHTIRPALRHPGEHTRQAGPFYRYR